jgi:hypothetical protein
MAQTNGNDKLDILIDQVGRLTEGLTEIKTLIREQTAIADRQATSIDRQEQNISRLVQVVERLIERG